MVKSAVTATEEPDCEQALAERDRPVAPMEGDQLPLDQPLVGYRRGAGLPGSCRMRLQAVEDQVKVLEDRQLEPWTGA